jgi:hypothetical protein
MVRRVPEADANDLVFPLAPENLHCLRWLDGC